MVFVNSLRKIKLIKINYLLTSFLKHNQIEEEIIVIIKEFFHKRKTFLQIKHLSLAFLMISKVFVNRLQQVVQLKEQPTLFNKVGDNL